MKKYGRPRCEINMRVCEQYMIYMIWMFCSLMYFSYIMLLNFEGYFLFISFLGYVQNSKYQQPPHS